MVNSASRYACVGLWIADLRTLHKPLEKLLQSQPGEMYHPGPLMSYPSLTELTRNPVGSRAHVEKNWFLFFPRPGEAFLHYDLSVPRFVVDKEENGTGWEKVVVGGRTFAKVIGNGFTTPNLTDPTEPPCLPDELDPRGKHGNWHQTSNALKLILCRRAEAERGDCSEEQEGRAVHFAVMHRKFSNDWDLPLRYERFFVVWDARPPFRMLGTSRYPVLMANETASGWSAEENWDDNDDDDDIEHISRWDDLPSDWRGEYHTAAAIAEALHANIHNSSHASSSSSSPSHRSTRAGNLTTTATVPPPSPQRKQTQDPKPTSNWASFTYTPSISWSFRLHPVAHSSQHDNDDNDDDDDDENNQHSRVLEALNVGYLDDEVILGIGVDDVGQGWARGKAEVLLACLRGCVADEA